MKLNDNDKLDLSKPAFQKTESCLSTTTSLGKIDMGKQEAKPENAESLTNNSNTLTPIGFSTVTGDIHKGESNLLEIIPSDKNGHRDTSEKDNPIVVQVNLETTAIENKLKVLDSKESEVISHTGMDKQAQDLLNTGADCIFKGCENKAAFTENEPISIGSTKVESNTSCTSTNYQEQVQLNKGTDDSLSPMISQNSGLVESIPPVKESNTSTNKMEQDLLRYEITEIVDNKRYELEKKFDSDIQAIFAEKFEKAKVEITATYLIDSKLYAKIFRRARIIATKDMARFIVEYITATRAELKDTFGISREQLNKWVKNGTITAIKLGRATRYRWLEVKNAIFGRLH